MTKQQIIHQLLPGALLIYEQFHILPSVNLAQAILETGWLRNCKGNNLFGIKWTKNCRHESQDLNTTEYIRGVRTPVKYKFKKYKTYEDSFIDHGELLYYSSRYKAVIESKTYDEACYNLCKCGYAADPSYAEKLIKIIEDNKLYIYDSSSGSNNESNRDAAIDLKDASVIKKIQSTLNKPHIRDRNNNILMVDGIYGALTRSAVMKLEEILELKIDGIWDSYLSNIVNSILEKSLCSIKNPFSIKVTRYIQFRVGAVIDGIWGTETDTKIKEYQQNNHLVVDGRIGNRTWNALLRNLKVQILKSNGTFAMMLTRTGQLPTT